MSVTQPTHDWDFRQTVSAGGTVKDNINGTFATYNNGLTSDPIKGLDLSDDNGEGANDKFASLAPFNTGTEFSMEFYFQKTAHADGQTWPMLSHITNTTSDYSSSDNFFATSWSMSVEPHYLYYKIQGNDGTLNSILIDDANVYAHVVFTFNDTTKEINTYLNGSLVLTDGPKNSVSFTDTTYTYNYLGATPVQMGTHKRQFNCYLYYFRYWRNGVLTADEVSTLYANRATTNYFGTQPLPIPTHDWDFRQTISAGGTIGDNINGTTATLTGVAADATNGAALTNSNHTDYIALNPFNTGTEFSMEFYFQKLTFTSTNWPNLIHISDSQTGYSPHFCYFQHDKTNNDLQTAFNSSSYYGISDSTNLIFADNDYVHFVVTWNDTSKELNHYLNGSLVDTVTLSSLSFTDANYTYNYLGNNTSLVSKGYNANFYYFRYWKNGILSSSDVSTLYANRSAINYFSLANMRINYGDVYLAQTLIKTFADYKAENIPLQDISFAAFPINKFKETYILGDVDISGDTILRSNNTYFTDISADTFDISGNLLMSDLSANGRLFVDSDVSFNSNVTIHGDLSFGADVSFNATFTRSQANIGTGAGFVINTDFSMNANLELNGTTTIKNDLHFNAYSDVSANPVLTDGTLLHNQKMEKLDHRYLLDISRSAPFSTLNYNTLPSEIWDNSANSGICISGDGKYIRTVNSSDVSANALSYYSEDYGSSFQVDNDLSTKLSQFDVSINSLDDYHATLLQSTTPKFGSDKVFMSYNGQHQLVPKGVSNKLTYDDFLYVSNNFGKNWNLRKNNNISTTTYSYTVTANGSSNYILNGGGFSSEAQPAVHIYLNESVQFTIDTTTNGSHPFKIGTSTNGGEITDSTITSVTSGSNQIITFKPTTSGTFYYYCSFHSGMGNSINVVEPTGRFNIDASGGSWFWNTGAVSADGKHMYVSGSTGIWKSQDFGTSWYQASADSSFNYMSISADGKQVYGVNERKVYGSSDYGNTFSTLYTDAYTSDSSYCGISTSGNGKYITIADTKGSDIYMSSNYGNTFDLTPAHDNDFTVANITTPTKDWNFLTSQTDGNFIYDNISNIAIEYQGVTSDETNGFATSGNSGRARITAGAVTFQSSFSFEIIVRINSSLSYNQLFYSHSGDGLYGTHLYYGTSSSNKLYFSVSLDSFRSLFRSDTQGTYTGSALSTDGSTYYHIVCVLDGANDSAYIYQDGTKIWEITSLGISESDFPITPSIYVALGREQQATNINVKRFRIWENTALSSTEIANLYNDQTTNYKALLPSVNCGMSHSGKIILNSNYISFDYGNNFLFVPDLISNNLSNRDSFYSKASMEYLLDPSNNSLLQIPYKSAIFQDIYSVGTVTVGSTTYSSDYRLKENVEDLGEEHTINELKPVKYYNTNLHRNDYGLIAHELQEKYPFLVNGEKDGTDPQSINYNGLISLLVHEVKNLKKEFLELKELKK